VIKLDIGIQTINQLSISKRIITDVAQFYSSIYLGLHSPIKESLSQPVNCGG